MKFRYLGNKERMVAFGHDFSNGNEPDVTDANAIKRLSANRFFEALDGDQKEEQKNQHQEPPAGQPGPVEPAKEEHPQEQTEQVEPVEKEPATDGLAEEMPVESADAQASLELPVQEPPIEQPEQITVKPGKKK